MRYCFHFTEEEAGPRKRGAQWVLESGALCRGARGPEPTASLQWFVDITHVCVFSCVRSNSSRGCRPVESQLAALPPPPVAPLYHVPAQEGAFSHQLGLRDPCIGLEPRPLVSSQILLKWLYFQVLLCARRPGRRGPLPDSEYWLQQLGSGSPPWRPGRLGKAPRHTPTRAALLWPTFPYDGPSGGPSQCLFRKTMPLPVSPWTEEGYPL